MHVHARMGIAWVNTCVRARVRGSGASWGRCMCVLMHGDTGCVPWMGAGGSGCYVQCHACSSSKAPQGCYWAINNYCKRCWVFWGESSTGEAWWWWEQKFHGGREYFGTLAAVVLSAVAGRDEELSLVYRQHVLQLRHSKPMAVWPGHVLLCALHLVPGSGGFWSFSLVELEAGVV